MIEWQIYSDKITFGNIMKYTIENKKKERVELKVIQKTDDDVLTDCSILCAQIFSVYKVYACMTYI